MRHVASLVAAALRKPSAEANTSARYPYADRRCSSAQRTPASSSTTAITLRRIFTLPHRHKESIRGFATARLVRSRLEVGAICRLDVIWATCRERLVMICQKFVGACQPESETEMARELPSAAGGVARLAYARAKAAGVALEPLLKKAGLSAHQIEDERVRLKVRDQIRFLNVAASTLEDEYLGFHLAQLLELRQVGLLYYVLASSETLIEAVQRAVRYSSIANDGIILKCIDAGHVGISLRYVGVSRHLDRHQIEFWVTAIVRICRQLTGLRLLPSRVRLTHLRERRSTELSEFFGDDIQFGASADEIAFAGICPSSAPTATSISSWSVTAKRPLLVDEITVVLFDQTSKMRSLRCCRTGKRGPQQSHANSG